MFSLIEKEHRRKNRLHQLNEMHEEIDKDMEQFAKMEIDDLLDALISYQNIKNIIGESEFFDRMIEKTKEALKMIS